MKYGLILYLFHLVGVIQFVCSFLGIVSCVLGAGELSQDRNSEEASKLFKFGLSCLFVFALIPSKRDLIIISGVVAFSETVDETVKIPPKLIKLINKELDTELKGVK